MKNFIKSKILKITIIIAVLFTMTFAACGNFEKSIISKWTTEFDIGLNTTFEFKSNNEVDVISYFDSNGYIREEVFGGKYTITKNKIEIVLSNGEQATWDYKINGDKLTLSADGDEIVLKKVN